MNPELERLLPLVEKPARYVGGEYGRVVKEPSESEVSLALCFPDVYEIGMSNLGMSILYGLANSLPYCRCERVYAPWADMEAQMRKSGLPLWALESSMPVSGFDIAGFSIGYEMAYTTVLNMLDLSGIPLRSSDRGDTFPIIIAGGVCCVNPEPLAYFIDAFIIGDGEDVLPELLAVVRYAKRQKLGKSALLDTVSELEGVYVPSRYSVAYNSDGTISGISGADGAPAKHVRKRIVQNLDLAYYPISPIVPSTEIVHDRVSAELFRGCIRGCRFCQAGFVGRPVRARSPKTVVEMTKQALLSTGYDEVTLSSLSSSDYRALGGVCDNLLDFCEPRQISLSLPSLRADSFSVDITKRLQKVRRAGLTFAPEAGSQRLRDVINKNVTEDELLSTCRLAFEAGWNAVKLYFMLGLPTETDEDILAIAELSGKVLWRWKQSSPDKSRGVRITVSTSCFVPKPHTPFQWEAQISPAEYERRVKLLRENMRAKAITYNWHDSNTALVEGVLARGDRRLGGALERVWSGGGRLESWSENFSLARWDNALSESGLSADFYALRERAPSELLPWNAIDTGLSDKFLWREREAAYAGKLTPDCRSSCGGCGASALLEGGVCDA